MKYRRMRLLVMFDLPTTTKPQRKRATKFRDFLLDDGYYFLQYSCYVRICANYDDALKHENRLKNTVPPEGTVRSIKITEKQYLELREWIGQKSDWYDNEASGEQMILF